MSSELEKGAELNSAPFSVQLSVVIPTLNEAATLPHLLADLAAQEGVDLEVLISDGGSTDGNAKLVDAELARLGLSGTVLEGVSGRGRQLNRGAAAARGEWLLFLHADSRLPDPSALSASLASLLKAGPRVAGHFALRFAPPAGGAKLCYRYCELKARLDLPGTIHGDQGFLLRTDFFKELGGFREDLPVLEDTLLAEQIRARGVWQLLPADIITSPRRFEIEGFRQRQTLNALLMNFAMIGWFEPLCRAPEVYRSQDRVRPLRPAVFYRLVDRLLGELPWSNRLRIWYRTGEFVRGNAWQLALWRALRRNRLLHATAATGAVASFRRWYEPLTAHPPGCLLAALLTWLWFRSRKRRDDVV